jgi:hypothetical protein
MRKIESEMVAAIRAKQAFCKGNTHVHSPVRVLGETEAEDFDVMSVFLHGNEIATVFHPGTEEEWTSVDLNTLRRWPTRTTMSRLRALGVDVCTRKGQVFIEGSAI